MRFIAFVVIYMIHQTTLGQSFTKKAFTLGDEKDFITASCELVPECDGCSGELVLLTSSTFAVIDRCVSGDTFYSGSYTIKNSVITLSFTQKVVNEEEDEATNTKKLTLRPITLKNQEFKIRSCGRELIIEGTGGFYKYGVSMDEKTGMALSRALTKSTAFKMLNN